MESVKLDGVAARHQEQKMELVATDRQGQQPNTGAFDATETVAEVHRGPGFREWLDGCSYLYLDIGTNRGKTA